MRIHFLNLFQLLETTSLVCGHFFCLQSQKRPAVSSHCVTSNPILLPAPSIFKDRGDYIEPPQIIQDNLLISESIKNFNSFCKLNVPAPCNIECSQVAQIRNWTSSGAIILPATPDSKRTPAHPAARCGYGIVYQPVRYKQIVQFPESSLKRKGHSLHNTFSILLSEIRYNGWSCSSHTRPGKYHLIGMTEWIPKRSLGL